MQLVFLLYVDHFDCHELVSLVIFAFVDMRAVAQPYLV